MEGVVGRIVHRARRDRPRLIAITEPNHYSASSHQLHFELMCRLLSARLVDVISSERLGLFDALLMNAWVEGRLECGAQELYEEILPLGGLGTLRWLRWLRREFREGRRHRLVGFEADFWFHLNRHGPAHPRTVAAVRQLASPGLRRLIRRLDVVPAGFTPETSTDLEILRALQTAHRHRYHRDARFDIWVENMRKLPQARIFINGFHLARGEEIGPQIPGRQLLIGMASFHRFTPTRTLTRGWLRSYRLSDEDFRTGSARFWDAYYKSMRGRHPVGYRAPFCAQEVKNISRYITPTPLERQFKGEFALIDTAQYRDQYISQSGWDTMPVMGVVMDTDHPAIRKPVDKFDLVVFIPRSTFNVKMYM